MRKKSVAVFPGLSVPEAPIDSGTQDQHKLKISQCSDSAVLYPLLHTLLQLRGIPFKPAYTRKETRTILGYSEKTLGRKIRQGRLRVYDLPDVCASATDIESFLTQGRSK